jgi:hypothetical protein
MTFNTYDRDRERGAPVDLYEFICGPTSYLYTNADAPILGYTPIPIQRQALKTNGKFEKTNLQIRVPVDTPLSETFLPYPPPYVVKFVLRQVHLTDPDSQPLVVWSGRIISSGRERNEAVLTADSTILSFKRPGLRRNFQHGCPLLLFGNLCRANKESFKKVIDVAEMLDGKIIVDAAWPLPWTHDKFRGGTLQWTSDLGTETRTIIATTPTSFTVGGALRGVDIGTRLNLYLGCRHDMDDCRATFNNINNYGGQPWIPFKNPVKQHPFW